MPGRPTKLTPQVSKRICKAIAGGNFYKAACVFAGVDYVTFCRWMNRGDQEESGIYRQFRNAVHKAQADAEAAIVASWRKQVPKDWKAARDFLARRYPGRWGPKQKHELTGAKGGPLTMTIVEEIVAGDADKAGSPA